MDFDKIANFLQLIKQGKRDSQFNYATYKLIKFLINLLNEYIEDKIKVEQKLIEAPKPLPQAPPQSMDGDKKKNTFEGCNPAPFAEFDPFERAQTTEHKKQEIKESIEESPKNEQKPEQNEKPAIIEPVKEEPEYVPIMSLNNNIEEAEHSLIEGEDIPSELLNELGELMTNQIKKLEKKIEKSNKQLNEQINKATQEIKSKSQPKEPTEAEKNLKLRNELMEQMIRNANKKTGLFNKKKANYEIRL